MGMKLSGITYNPSLGFGQNAWDQSVSITLIVTIVVGLSIIYLYRWLNKNELTRPKDTERIKRSKTKSSFGIWNSLVYVARSPYLFYLVVIVVSYNLVYNLTETVVIKQIEIRFTEKNEFTSYMSRMTITQGVMATFMAIFLTGPVISRFGWMIASLVTPVLIFITSGLFFGLINFGDSSYALWAAGALGISLPALTIWIGATQNCLTRASKYTFFDATKELSFIPLDFASQRKGKAAIDGIASRIGKSGGSAIYQVLLLFCSGINATIPFVSTSVIILIGCWIFAVFRLDTEMKKVATKK